MSCSTERRSSYLGMKPAHYQTVSHNAIDAILRLLSHIALFNIRAGTPG
uniref:Uncharacterized protein n=1 Tax=Anguilla anguilla TaxID=7936 RepID=A0A0E9W4E4_ANGAN